MRVRDPRLCRSLLRLALSGDASPALDSGTVWAGVGINVTLITGIVVFRKRRSLKWIQPQSPETKLNSQNRPASDTPPTFKHDNLQNFELGLKGEWWDRRLRTTLALYDMEWKDIQLQTVQNGLGFTINGGKARVQGVEWETQFAPIAHLVFSGALAYTDPKLISLDPGVTDAIGARVGDRLPYTPKWAGSFTADYRQPLPGDVQLSYGATYQYQGKRLSGFPDADANTGVVLPSYNTVDLRTGVEWSASRYEVQARVSNVANKHAYSTLNQWRLDSSTNPPAWAAVIQPRTFFLSATARF
jgi:outer membrane receptor protein involved in Fe transport